jgi:ElaB/YqjD/DUF883 family membrane-anchored ribosome-binding protein
MFRQTVDVDALLKKAASDIIVQGENLRAKVRNLTLQALQVRELSLAQIKQVLRSVADGVNTGAAKARIDVERPLADAFDGMDDALLQAVQASQIALERLLEHGADFENSRIRKALDELDSLEDEFLKIVKQSADAASAQIRTQWLGVFAHMPAGGTDAGARAEAVAARIAEQTRADLRQQRDGAAKVTHALVQNYGTLASGILIGLSEGLRNGNGHAKATEARRRKVKRGTSARA